MIKIRLFPASGLVATLTFVAVTAAVQIFGLVAGKATDLQILVVESIRMTKIAPELEVFVA